MADLRAQLRSYIEDNFILGAAARKFADGDSFMEHGILDSTGFLELITYLEETFGLTVKDEEMIPENLDSLDRLAAFIGRKQAA
jgi:acyl carrier protein